MSSIREQMAAQVINTFGPAREVFQLVNVPVPQVGPYDVLIDVKASSVNPVDCKIRSGLYPAITPEFPAILHGDISGIIVKKGDKVTKFKIGDEVYGCAGGFKGTQGAIAQYMLADPNLLAIKPSTISHEESAVLPLVSITAWLALIDRAGLTEGQSVLVHAASGGVGSIALQIAKWKGAEVFATASSEQKARFAESKGIKVINYKNESVEEYVKKYSKKGEGFDIVLDTVGGKNLAYSIDACKNAGTVCAIAACDSIDLRPLHRKGGTLHYVYMPLPIINKNAIEERRHFGQILSNISQLVDQGYLQPLIDQVLNFTDIAAAHELQEKNLIIGKISLRQNL